MHQVAAVVCCSNASRSFQRSGTPLDAFTDFITSSLPQPLPQGSRYGWLVNDHGSQIGLTDRDVPHRRDAMHLTQTAARLRHRDVEPQLIAWTYFATPDGVIQRGEVHELPFRL